MFIIKFILCELEEANSLHEFLKSRAEVLLCAAR